MTVFSTAKTEMSAAISKVQEDVRTALGIIAWPAEPGEKLKTTHDRLHKALKGQVTHRQIRALWRKEWKNIPAHIYLAVLERAEAHEQQLDAKLRAARERQAKLWSLIHHSSDPAFYRGRLAVDGDETD
jgi:hypothetical protein